MGSRLKILGPRTRLSTLFIYYWLGFQEFILPDNWQHIQVDPVNPGGNGICVKVPTGATRAHHDRLVLKKSESRLRSCVMSHGPISSCDGVKHYVSSYGVTHRDPRTEGLKWVHLPL